MAVASRLTKNFVRLELQRYGMTFVGTHWGEYRVNFKGGSEDTAYYTNDLDDALDTGRDMARRRADKLIEAEG